MVSRDVRIYKDESLCNHIITDNNGQYLHCILPKRHITRHEYAYGNVGVKYESSHDRDATIRKNLIKHKKGWY